MEEYRCICGQLFKTYESRIKEGRGKFCSKKCHYKNAFRPTGLTYKIKIKNKGWFKKGHSPKNGIKKGERKSPKTEFKKGSTPWLKGKKHPVYGEKHHNWKGGISTANEKIRQSPESREWRRNVFKRDNYTCRLCDKRGEEIQADHIKSFAYHPKLRFKLSNGRTLCVKCHKTKTDWGYKTVKRYAK